MRCKIQLIVRLWICRVDGSRVANGTTVQGRSLHRVHYWCARCPGSFLRRPPTRRARHSGRVQSNSRRPESPRVRDRRHTNCGPIANDAEHMQLTSAFRSTFTRIFQNFQRKKTFHSWHLQLMPTILGKTLTSLDDQKYRPCEETAIAQEPVCLFCRKHSSEQYLRPANSKGIKDIGLLQCTHGTSSPDNITTPNDQNPGSNACMTAAVRKQTNKNEHDAYSTSRSSESGFCSKGAFFSFRHSRQPS